MELITSFITKNPYFDHPEMKPRGAMLHSVGCAQPNANVFIRQWNQPDYYASSVHSIIDAETGVCYQTLPWNLRGEHCGGAGNDFLIGVEMCESCDITYVGGSYFVVNDTDSARKHAERAYKSAVELFAFLAKTYGWNPDKDIYSHKEGAMIGIASGHSDPEHYWSQLGLPYTMNTFRAEVKAAMNGTIVKPVPMPSTNVSDIVYMVKTERDGWLPAVTNLEDYAGWKDSPIVSVAIRVPGYNVRYRVHTVGGYWLPWVTGFDKDDYHNGYAGDNFNHVDALQISINGASVEYRVQACGAANYFDWQRDTIADNGMDGYAGLYGMPITKLQCRIIGEK